ncbi:MAG: HD domain-containing protein [Candidatus Magasanikbacteria bacterium]|jgi:poly(A) polymerase|nr:HD domain-containing protein [Candidatus Magasanikbacteria bacterium]
MNDAHILSTIGKISSAQQTEAYVVGGFVRDAIMGRNQKKDIDVVVAGSGLEFARAYLAYEGEEQGRLIEFEDFDTARYVYIEEAEGEKTKVLFEVEFAGARSESYRSESRKPVVEPATIEQDLSRRDFTCNAMAQKVHPDGSLGDVVDPYNGKEAIINKKLITPLDPDETFFDDPLRMLRAARFAAQLDFSIEESVLLSMHKNRERLSIVSAERVQEELMKLMGAKVPSIGLWLMHGAKLMDQCLPEVTELAGVEEVAGYTHKDNLSHTFAVVDGIAQQGGNALLCFAGLMHDIAKPPTKKFAEGRGWTFDMHEHLGRKMCKDIMRKLRFSKNDTHFVSELVRWHLQPIALMDNGVTDSAVRRLFVNQGDSLDDLLTLCRADITTGNQKKKVKRLKNYDELEKRIAEIREKDELRAFQSPVRGEEIIEECGLKPGPTIGKIKKAIEEAILDGKVQNDYESASAYFEQIKSEFVAGAEEWEKLA